MVVPNPQALTLYDPRPFDVTLIDVTPEDKGERAVLAKTQVAPPPVAAKPEPEPQSSPNSQAIVRANLRAAAQHAALGHEGRSFRECSHATCQNASNLIPHLVALEQEMTAAEPSPVFDQTPGLLEDETSVLVV
jgi:hypothetical protein